MQDIPAGGEDARWRLTGVALVTRDGHQIGKLVPIRRRRRFVSRQEFAVMSRNAPASVMDAFRADQDAAAEHEDSDP
jgi:antitoxin (DNA-binding transcriptional repressor) of toxin-antitoxin stability system